MTRRMGSAIVLTGIFFTVFVAGRATATPSGTRLVSTVTRITADESGGRVIASLPTYLDFYDGLRIQVRRRDYQTRIGATRTGPTPAAIDPRLLAGWAGFRKALTVVVRDADGSLVVKKRRDWCPNSAMPQRISPDGPDTPTFPESCSANPFTLATIWGVDPGWATPAGDFIEFPGRAGRYRVTVSIAPKVARIINLPVDRRSITVAVAARHQTDGPCCTPPLARTAASSALAPAASTTPRPLPRTLDAGPPADTLPDIASLPAFWISTSHENRRDLLNFAANEWNAGPGPMVIEGYRDTGRTTMRAYQVFYRNGQPVASVRNGTMEFHAAPEHHHWHFLNFARYDLVTPTSDLVRTSGKQSWCLAPTDPIDLIRPNSTLRPFITGLGSACGGIDAMWLRETLPVGWGDTYMQFQTVAINITTVPNGIYKIRITANPKGNIRETTRANNVSYRTVVIGGTPGRRTVRVPKYGLVNSDKILMRP